MKLAVFRKPGGDPLSVVVDPSGQGVGVSTTLGLSRGSAGSVDGLAIVASSCMLADAAAAGVQALASKPNGFGAALSYLRRIDGVRGGIVLMGERIGVAGQLEIAA